MDFMPTFPPPLTPLIAFGLLLIVGAIGGYLAHRASWLPSITGFMIVGFLSGPGGLGVLDDDAITAARPLIDVALALILYRLGLSLDTRALWRSRRLFFVALAECTATFIVVAGVLIAFSVPAALAALIGAIAISSSPAVLLHVAHEVGAEGPATETAKTLVALNNLFSFLAFSTILPLLHYESGSGWVTIVFQPTYQLMGSLIVGIALGIALHTLATRTRTAGQYRLALVVGCMMIAVGLSESLKLSMLFVSLVIGVTVRSLERETLVSDLEFGPAFELMFIVLFVFAGARLHLDALVHNAGIVVALVLARGLGKTTAALSGLAIARVPLRRSAGISLLLIPMAGLAIGLTLTTSALFPQFAATLSAIVLGAVTVFETLGPPVAAFAFRFAGESADRRAPQAEPAEPTTPPDAEPAPEASGNP